MLSIISYQANAKQNLKEMPQSIHQIITKEADPNVDN